MSDSLAAPAAILLAAGNSERMGRPKPLLKWRGDSFLARQVRVYQSAGCAVYVVLGRDAERIAAACPPVSQAALLLNPHPERGMLSSLKIAVAGLATSTPAFFFTPVDNPGVRRETLLALLALKAQVALPRYKGRRGHPVLLGGSLAPDLLAWPDSSTPRDFILARRDSSVYADVDDPFVTLDIDTPDEYRRLLAEELP